MFQKNEEEIKTQKTNSTEENAFVIISTGTSVTDVEIPKKGVANQSTNLIRKEKGNNKITAKARKYIDECENIIQVEQANIILDLIEKILSDNNDLALPEIHISKGDDGSIGLSWRVDNDLLGISIDQDPKTSSFFLLMGKEESAMKAYGSLYDKIDLDLLIEFLVNLLSRVRSRQESKNE